MGAKTRRLLGVASVWIRPGRQDNSERRRLQPLTRRRILTPAQVSIIDAWYAIKGRNKQPPAKCMAHKMGCSLRTLWNAIHRKDGYSGVPQPARLCSEACSKTLT